MAGTADLVFLRAFKWLQAAVDALEADIAGPASGPAALAAPLPSLLRTHLGLELDKTAATIDPDHFAASNAEAQSLAVATMVTGETLAALKTIGEILAGLGNGNVGISDLSKVIRQIARITSANPGQAAERVLDRQAAADPERRCRRARRASAGAPTRLPAEGPGPGRATR